ncbi:MAG: endonuclease III [Bacteroidales bacterium]|nr:endonuclease III [Bacteroidales bacterium]
MKKKITADDHHLKAKFKAFIDWFSVNMPVAETELEFDSPYQLLVAVILSAQCTDKRVNIITPNFFIEFPTAKVLSVASVEAIFDKIRSCSYPNNKAKNLLGMAKKLVNDFQEVVPADIDELQSLPGVGRKTANVIASVVFNKPTMAVDTHVFRVSQRIGLTINAKNPFDSERQLVKYIPEEWIPKAHHWLILHGRYVCKARRPMCQTCGISSICDWYRINSLS